ncbi:MAG: hypothetical protein BYD32DRAFT_406196 [Podila humilis]|nr:MAG: hypothetical protein BYD32DRAFT_406196 [Podila humilis]
MTSETCIICDPHFSNGYPAQGLLQRVSSTRLVSGGGSWEQKHDVPSSVIAYWYWFVLQ